MTHPLTPREKVEPSLDDLLRQAVETMKSWTPEQREAHFEAQKKAWVAAEMAFGDEGTRVVTALASGSGDHAELARLAEAATPGPWEWWSSCSHWRLTGADRRDGGVISATKASDGFPLVVCNGDDRAFIAAANPDTILALLAENAALRVLADDAAKHSMRQTDKLLAEHDRATEAERRLAEAVGLLTGLAAIFRGNPRMSSLVAWWNRSKQQIYALSSKEAERG